MTTLFMPGLGFDLGPQAVRQSDNELIHIPAGTGRQFGYNGCSFHDQPSAFTNR